jgi:predicted XRE-type DNA-binding protein
MRIKKDQWWKSPLVTNKLNSVWGYIDKREQNECWEWTKSLSSGYGRMRVGGRKMLAHRIVYELMNGSIPKHTLILHKCDNRKCCNPDHLFIGSHQDNMDDKMNKHRCNSPFGEEHGRSKLKKDDISEIKRLYLETNVSQRKLSTIFGVTQANIWYIINNKSWRNKLLI